MVLNFCGYFVVLNCCGYFYGAKFLWVFCAAQFFSAHFFSGTKIILNFLWVFL